MPDIKDGQIYRWRWADKERGVDNAPYRSYHCKSQIAVVKNGRLYDTFWSSYDDWLERGKVDLTLLCDESWTRISDYQIPLYDRQDIADTRHSNDHRAPIYLRPGAMKSAASILEEITYREEKAQGDIRHAKWALEKLAADRKLIAEGKIDEVRL